MEAHLYNMAALCLGISGHIAKKVYERRREDLTFSLAKYIIGYPYQAYLSVVCAIGAYLALHVSETLTVASAFLAGWSANSLGDVAPGKRNHTGV